MAKALRQMDHAADDAVMEYLDRHFYPHYTNNFQRFNDVDTQMQGVDTKFDYNELKGILVDEKALTHYINTNLPTFAFEIDFVRYGGQLTPGWFYDDAKQTQYYLLSWITADIDNAIDRKKRALHLTANNITELDTLLISRTAIREMLFGYGVTADSAATTARRVRENNEWGYFQKNEALPFNFFFSSDLAERPINIVVRKAKLIEIATARFTITPVKAQVG